MCVCVCMSVHIYCKERQQLKMWSVHPSNSSESERKQFHFIWLVHFCSTVASPMGQLLCAPAGKPMFAFTEIIFPHFHLQTATVRSSLLSEKGHACLRSHPSGKTIYYFDFKMKRHFAASTPWLYLELTTTQVSDVNLLLTRFVRLAREKFGS